MADIELVIKIPKAEYELIVNDEACGLNVLTRAIANGTPRDDIKAEIKANILDEPATNGTNGEMACYNSGLLTTLEIIDKHTKEGDA